MKHTYPTAAALLASTVLTAGATDQSQFSHNPNQGPALATAAVYPIGAPSCGPIDITCNQAKNIEPFGSVACENAGVTADNQYYRHFIMADYGLPDEYTVTCVTIGIETATADPAAGGVQPITINLYDIGPAGFPAPVPLPSLIGTADFDIADQTFTLIELPISASGTSGGLVVEVSVPDAVNNGLLHSFFLGANSLPESCLSYLSSVACGTPNPVPTAAVGFPNAHYVMNVKLEESCPADLDGNGNVGIEDFLELLANWGPCP